ncbi:multidrug resistance-associated ABC transporter [Mycena amicta]|nr:multidrug resistance-associated ABC transporter [Mycena amicta]
MDSRQLLLAALFAATATFSGLALAHYYASRYGSEGTIALHRKIDSFPSIQAVMFDLAGPTDFVDGFPIDETGFWARIWWHKISLVAVLLAQATLAALASDLDIVQFSFLLYLLLLAVLSARTQDLETHARLNAILASLTSTALLILASDALVPSTDIVSSLSTIALYLVATSIALTIPRGPLQHFPAANIYAPSVIASAKDPRPNNVHGAVDASPLSALFFSYISKIITLPSGFGVADLPILTASMRATVNFSRIRTALLQYRYWSLPPGLRFGVLTMRTNAISLLSVLVLSATIAALRYVPAYCMRNLLQILEQRQSAELSREAKQWGFVYVTAQLATALAFGFGWGQLWNRAHITDIQMVAQTNTLLFMKTLVRKDVASQSANAKNAAAQFAHKADIITVMSQDVHRISSMSIQIYTLTDAVVQLVLGTWLLYSLLGVSAFVGLVAALVSVPLQQYIGKIIIRTQQALMKAKDERIALTNEILGGIRMIKFMAWERNFEAKLWAIRDKELEGQKTTYLMKTLLTAIGNLIPLLFALASFGHYTITRHETLSPSIAFTAILIFNGIQYAISGFPEAILAGIQCFVSLRRIDQYLDGLEVSATQSENISSPYRIALSSASITWPAANPTAFKLANLTLEFPIGELSLVCGKVGSGKSLLLLGLLGEAEIVSGHVFCPRSSPDFLANSANAIDAANWVVAGACAYVPQTAWLRNQSIRDNILFELPFSAERYAKTLEVCALLPDLEIFQYGDLSEIGERGITLSTGQKARVSLARAVYSRASILLLDDILSAVDVHTAHHLYHECLKGELMHGRTVILVSHHIQLSADGATHIVALDKGEVMFQGDPVGFRCSSAFLGLSQSKHIVEGSLPEPDLATKDGLSRPTISTAAPTALKLASTGGTGTVPKLVAEEVSSVGRIDWDVWKTLLGAYGGRFFWLSFAIVLLIASLGPVFENSYLRIWSDAGEGQRPLHYLLIYAAILCINLGFRMTHLLILYHGSIKSSTILYRRLLETVLFSGIRFHDTNARGGLLNRFGKDIQIIDGSIADDFGRTLKLGLSTAVTLITITVVGGLTFALAVFALGIAFAIASQDYGHTSRDMRRLVSTTFSPLYSIYDNAVTGVVVIRSFGASTTFLRSMMRFVDANSCACHWQWGLNRWFSVISIAFGSSIVAAVGLVVLLSPSIDASLAGMALVFASTISAELMYFVRAFVGLEQCLVAVERVKETSDAPREPPEIVEPRPPSDWPANGEISCEDLSVRYAPGLPNVLHNASFRVSPGEKIGIVGRTGSGKTSLLLSFFRFIEPTSGRIVIDGVDISNIGLTDLRGRLTIIPQDPTILSGTLRLTLDAFGEYEDADIFEALRRVHLISDEANDSVFNDLDSPVSPGGNNFSAGQKQLLCMARAILKHSKILLIDEATASLDYATARKIQSTIREKFSGSTIITIAHRLRSIMDYDKVMVLRDGHIVEFDSPRALLERQDSQFSDMCQAAGKEEFATLRSLAGV